MTQNNTISDFLSVFTGIIYQDLDLDATHFLNQAKMCIQMRQKKKKRYENPIRELCEMFQLLQSICTESRHTTPHCRLTFHFWVNLRCVQPGEKAEKQGKDRGVRGSQGLDTGCGESSF